MPKAVHDLAKKLQAKGYPESKSWAIAYSSLLPNKRTSLKKRKKK